MSLEEPPRSRITPRAVFRDFGGFEMVTADENARQGVCYARKKFSHSKTSVDDMLKFMEYFLDVRSAVVLSKFTDANGEGWKLISMRFEDVPSRYRFK
ncbi:hypothetical protein ACEPAG_8489 [Sanghuangporus baumii]